MKTLPLNLYIITILLNPLAIITDLLQIHTLPTVLSTLSPHEPFINSLSIDYVDKAPNGALHLTFFDSRFFIFRLFFKRTSLRIGTKTLFHIIHNCLCGQSSTFSSCDENYSRRTLFMLTALLSSEPHGFLFQNMSHTSKDRQVAILISLFVFFAEMTKRMN